MGWHGYRTLGIAKQGTSFSYQEYIPNIPMVTDIKEVDQDILWVTSNTGVYEINKHTRQARLLFDHHWACMQDLSLDATLIGGADGLFFVYTWRGVEKDT